MNFTQKVQILHVEGPIGPKIGSNWSKIDPKGQNHIGGTIHRGQNSKQINIAKYVSNFLIYGAKMLDKCVKSQKNFFVHCPFLQSQAK